MSITNKVTVGLVSFAFMFSLVVVNSVTAATENPEEEIAQLLERIKELESMLSGGRSYTSTGSNAACSYTWTRNLSIGSTGDDVRQLQRFLNGNPQTQVAVTGVGSPGNESSYYGPATARAVSKFQEMYAAQILTPLGLTNGTGGFYTSTRAQLNEVCQRGSGSGISVNRAGTRSATSPAVVRVTGDALAVTAGNPISDSYVVLGAQRAPFTSVVLTAGTDDVRIESIRIKRFGLSSSDNFESIALVDANGVQVGSARSLNSRDEVSLGSNFIVPANRSVTLAVIGNMSTSEDDFNSGSIAGLEVAEVVADTRVQGTFPIRGAAHVLSTSVDLQKVEIEVGGGGGSIEFNESTEVASVTVDLTSNTVGDESADTEDAYLRSVILEQIGTVDVSEIGDLSVFVDDDRVDHTIAVDRDRFIINFGGKGVMIEEGDDVEVTVETTTDRGYEETVQFAIDDVSDVYVLGAAYGYGLPVCFSGDTTCDSDGGALSNTEGTTKTSVATISSGKVADGSSLKKFKDEVRYGNDVILAAHSVEFEGEDVVMEDLTFTVSLKGYSFTDRDNNAWEDADEETVRFDSVRLRVDGENVAYASDSIDFDEPDCDDDDGENAYSTDKDCDGTADDDGSLTVDFDGAFTVDVRKDREVIFEIVADLDAAWSHFDSTTVEFTLTDVDTAEGISSEKDYTDTGEYFASAKVFEKVKIMGNEIDFAINDDSMDGDEFVKGADNVVFGTFEIDAKDAIDDVELRDLYISFQIPAGTTTDSTYGSDTAVGDLSDLNNCRILDGAGDEVADSRGVTGEKTTAGASTPAETDQARFRFDDYVVEAGEREDLDIVCDIDDDAEAGDEYRIVVDTSENVNDRVKYRIGRDEDDYEFDSTDASSLVTVGESGSLVIKTDSPDEDESVIAVATGTGGVDDIAVLEIELEAESEDIEILDVYLALPLNMGAQVGGSGVAVTDDKLEDVYDRFTLKLDNTTADADDYEGTKTFDADMYDNVNSDITSLSLIAFEDVNEVVRDGDDNTEVFDLTFDFNGIDDSDGVAGQFIQGSTLIVVWEGVDSDSPNLTQKTIGASDFTVALPFPTVPTISTTKMSETLSASRQKVYEFTVNADDEGDVYIGQVGFQVTLSSNVSVTKMEVHRGTGEGTARATNSSISSSGAYVFEFTDTGLSGGTASPEQIDAGQSRTYSVYADVTGSLDDSDSITVEMLHDDKETNPSTGRQYNAVKAVNSGEVGLVWSPNALENDGATTSNADWFTGWTVVKSSDTKQWLLDR